MTKDTALKLALEALEDWDSPMALPAIYAIKEALAQDELCSSQKPVAGDVHTEHCFQGEYKHCCKYGDGDDCTAAPKQEPRNFCPRCGKRTADLTVIHTCTPPRGLEMT